MLEELLHSTTHVINMCRRLLRMYCLYYHFHYTYKSSKLESFSNKSPYMVVALQEDSTFLNLEYIQLFES